VIGDGARRRSAGVLYSPPDHDSIPRKYKIAGRAGHPVAARDQETRVPRYHVGPADGFTEGERRVVVCGDREVGVFRIDGGFHGWHNHCPHRGGPVFQGRIMKRVVEPLEADGGTRLLQFDGDETHIICPWHGWEFSITTGEHPGHQRARLRKVDIEVRDGEVYVSL
jgi:nitrite reductase/ring-hydroxylating ferredoxin subunit